MTTPEKSIDEQIKELQEQLDEEEPKELTKNEWEEKSLEEKIKELQDLLKDNNKEPNTETKRKETFKEEEKVLLAKIEAKSTIMYYLTLELDSAKQQKENLEKQLEVLRDCIIRTASDN